MNIHLRKQRGLSLISLMIALLIGTFLLAGLFAVWFQTRTTFKTQNQMAQVQDNQRMALIILGNTVESAGYYPVSMNYGTNPPNPLYQQSNVFPVAAPFTVAGQSVFGIHSTTTPNNDTLEVRFMPDPKAGNTLDCLGQSDAYPTLVTNTFTLTGTTLTCSVNNNPKAETIVTGVQSFVVYYGISTTQANSSVTEYLTADQVTADAMWGNVQSVNVRLTFVNPLYGEPGIPGQTSTPTLPIVSRIIALTQTAK
jgi:type IV pilus assembly protein PilW